MQKIAYNMLIIFKFTVTHVDLCIIQVNIGKIDEAAMIGMTNYDF